MNSLLADAGILMFLGMLTVFIFLLVLTGCVSLLTRLTAEIAQADPQVPRNPSSTQPNPEQLAAISSAVQRYRKSRH